jgi:colanic acid biosynthesis glycosyl transferase WcaI
MRVLFVAQNFYPEQLSNNALATSLIARGHEVDVLTQVPNYGKQTFFVGYSNQENRQGQWNGINIYRAFTIARGKRALTLAGNYLCFPLTATWTLWHVIKKRPDVIFVSLTSPIFQAFPAIFLRWLKGVPTVFWVQDIWPESLTSTLHINNPILTKLLMCLCGWTYRRADLLLVQSQAFPAMIERFGVPKERIRYLPNSAPPSFRRIEKKSAKVPELENKGDSFKIMFAGNIGTAQDFETLLKAATILCDRNILWAIVGSGSELEKLKSRVSELHLEHRFAFLGRHPEERMPDFFAHADALFVGLKDEYIFSLTVPYKIQCYLACGKPIIVSLSGEGKRVVEQADAGFGSLAEQPEELAVAIAKLMDLSDVAREEMGNKGIEYFRNHFAQDVVYGRFEEFLLEGAAAKPMV